MRAAKELCAVIMRDGFGKGLEWWAEQTERAIQSARADAREEERSERDSKWVEFIRLRWGDMEADDCASALAKKEGE